MSVYYKRTALYIMSKQRCIVFSIFVLPLNLLASADNSYANSLDPNQDQPGSKPIDTDRIPERIF